MAILCYGGSFNPIHHGHLICARHVAEKLGFTGVKLIPSGKSPHKNRSEEMAMGVHRVSMCRLAVASDPFFEVDDLEIRRGGESYTLDTVRSLKRMGQTDVHWLVGADLLPGLPDWHQPLELMAEATLHVMARPGSVIDFSALPEAYRVLSKNVVEAPQLEISATQIRRRCAAGLSIKYLVPSIVENYILANELYGALGE